jgi:WD40 repeat protein
LTPLSEAGTAVIVWLENGRLLAKPASLSSRSGVEIVTQDGQVQSQLATGSTSGISQLAAAADGRHLTILLNNGAVQTWSLADNRLSWEQAGGDQRANAIAWSPADDRLAAALNNRTVQIISGLTGETIGELTGSQFNLQTLAWSPDGIYLAGLTSGGRIVIWTVDDGRLLLNQPGVSALDWTPDGRYLTVGGYDGRLFFWETADLARGRFNDAHNWTLQETAVVGLNWLTEPLRLLSWSEDGWLRLHDGDDGSLIAERPDFNTAPFNAVSDLAWSPDGQTLAAGSWDRTIRLWAVAEATSSRVLRGHRTYIGPVDWSPDGQWLASGSLDSGGALRLWSLESGESQPLTYPDDRPVESLAFSPDGRWLAVGLRTGLLVIQPIPPDDSQAITSWRFHEAEITGLAWSPDSQRLLSAGADGAVALWQIPEGVLAREWWVESSGSDYLQAAWSPTQPLVALANSMKEIQLWQPDSGELVERLDGPSLVRVHQLNFSPHGRWLAAVGGRSQITIFALDSGEIAYEGNGHGATVRTAVWSPVTPNQLATGSDDGTIRLWLLPEGEPGR